MKQRLFAVAAFVVAAGLLVVPTVTSAKTTAGGTAASPTKMTAASVTARYTKAATQPAQPVPHAKTATQPAQPVPHTRAAWQADLAKVPAPGSGCYRGAAYPALAWHAVRCGAGPKWPLAPVPPSRSARHAAPSAVGGGGDDYEAQMAPGSISLATGTFQNVSSGIQEQGQVDATGPQVANAFSLQLNTELFASPLCTASSGCSDAWQQFLYTYSSSSAGYIYMQYWLLNHNSNCPSGWMYFGGGAGQLSGCYVDSSQTEVPALTASELASVQLSGSAAAGGNDTVSLSVGSGSPVMASAEDSMLDLAGTWQSTQWGVYGDAGGGKANFGANTSLEAVTALTDTSDSKKPTSVLGTFTAETNNLNLAPTSALTPGPYPMMGSEQTTATHTAFNVSTTAGTAPSILIVGDSISNGMLADYTWRYRLWQHLGSLARFVGHRTGTENIYDDPIDLALISNQAQPTDNYANPTDGYYNSGEDPNFSLTGGDQHDALWGWTYHLAKDYVAQDVSAYQPDYLLIELGFNDLAFENTPAGTLADAKTLIDNARAVDPAIKVVIANVVTRTPLLGYPSLNSTITTYNSDLAAAVPGWSTSASPVRLADISSNYDPSTDTYDGLHPNGVGEYVIADAFATTLANDFGLGTVPGSPPSSVPGITLTTPASMNGSISQQGPLLQWSRVYGASGYRIYERDITGNPSPLPAFSELPLPIPGDHWYAGWGTPGDTYQYEVASARGTSESGTSSPVTLTMPNPEPVAAAPTNVTVTPSAGSTSIALSWTPPSGDPNDSSVSSYEVFWEDASNTYSGELPDEAFVSGTSYTITGLNPGDTYDLAIASVNADGAGPWGGAPAAIVGEGAPATSPVIPTGPNDTLTWPAVPGATGYWIYQANPGTTPLTWTRLIYEVPQGWNGSLAAGGYYLTAANASLESSPSNQLTLPLLAASAHAITGAAMLKSGAVNPAAWIPNWLRAAPNLAALAMLERRA